MILSLPKSITLFHWLGMPFVVEQSHYGFWAVFDCDDQNVEPELEGKILHKFFKMNKNES